MEISDILSQESVLYCADISTKPELLARLAHQAAKLTRHPADAILTAITDREELGSTGLGNGIAIPHGKLVGLPRVTAVFARLANPIDFDAVDDVPVDVVMLLLAPVGSGADHLKALAKVARLLRTDSVLSALRGTSEPERLYSVLMTPDAAHFAA